jgi:HAE1 family hydrophobic/amphiphilic exporter-1
VPVSIVGTFIFFPLLGFSVNTLSMFGLVLAIGIVVDDAIVVVEAVMHHIEHGMSPRDATAQAMKEVSAPVIGIALILSAVFIPGRVHQRPHRADVPAVRAHDRDLGAALAFSALSLSPALAAMLLKPARPARGPLGAFFRGFNRCSTGDDGLHQRRPPADPARVITIVIVGSWWSGSCSSARRCRPDSSRRGSGALRDQRAAAAGGFARADQRGAAPGRGDAARVEGVESFQTIGGYGRVTSTYQPNFGSIFVRLKPWDERHDESLHVNGIMRRMRHSSPRSRRRWPFRSTSRPSPASARRRVSTSCFRIGAAR